MLIVPSEDGQDREIDFTLGSPSGAGEDPTTQPKIDQVILQLPRVHADAEEFAQTGSQIVDKDSEVLNIIQGEVAVAEPGDGPLALGSDSATTCHIVAFRNPSTGRTCLAHLDDSKRVAEAVGCMLALVSSKTDRGGNSSDAGGSEDQGGKLELDIAASLMGPLDLYIVGGFLGEAIADDLSFALLSTLHASRQTFRMVLVCISAVNSRRSYAGETKAFSSAAAAASNDNNDRNNINNKSAPPATIERPQVDTSPIPASSSSSSSSSLLSPASTDHARPDHTASRQGTDVPATSDNTGGDGVRASEDDAWLPRQTSVAIDLATGHAFSVRFEGVGRGPGIELRHSRIWAGAREEVLARIYDAPSDSIVVSPFPLCMGPSELRYLLMLPDQELLAITSTSPEVEDPRYVQDVRSQFSFILKNVGADGEGWWDNVFCQGGRREGNPVVFRRGGESRNGGAVDLKI